MIPRFRPKITTRQLLSSLNVFSGKEKVARYESDFATKAGQKYAVSYGYGRTAIIAALQAAGVKNQKIICPAYTCVVVAHAIKYSGNSPVFVDCAPDSYNMDNEKVKKLMESESDIGAIIFTSIFGEPVDLDFVKDFRAKYPKVFTIQDCAHSFFAEWKGEPVQIEGDVAIYGLNVSKIIHSVFGGMLTTDSKAYYDKLLQSRKSLDKPNMVKALKRTIYYFCVWVAFQPFFYWFVNFLDRKGILGGLSEYYQDDSIDMPTDYLEAMDPVSASVGIQQILEYDSIVEMRRKCAEIYLSRLSELKGIVLPKKVPGHTFSHFVVLVEEREKMLADFIEKGIQLGWLIEYSVPYMGAYKKECRNDCPISLDHSKKSINLPLYDAKVAEKVSAEIINYYSA